MGIIKAMTGATGGMFADQWKEFFFNGHIPMDTLVVRGSAHHSERSSNTKGEDGVITDGSIVSLAAGENAAVIKGGKLVAVLEEPGENVFHSEASSGIFGEGGVGGMVRDAWRRFTFGGDAPHASSYIYFINMREMMGNHFQTDAPVPIRIVDPTTGLDFDAGVQLSGMFSFRVCDSAILFQKVVGNVVDSFKVEQIASQLVSEMKTQIQATLSEVSTSRNLRMSELATMIDSLQTTVKDRVDPMWSQDRGIKLGSLSFDSVHLTDRDSRVIADLQVASTLKDPVAAAAYLNSAIADSVRIAAGNPAGAGIGAMGVAGVGAIGFSGAAGVAAAGAANASPASWTCGCGFEATGNFCSSCGKQRPGWYCTDCGTHNTGAFCTECGTRRA